MPHTHIKYITFDFPALRKFVLLSFLFAFISKTAGTGYTAERMESRIIFHVNRYDIDPQFSGNSKSLNDISRFIEKAIADSTIEIKEIVFCGYASPEGPRLFNRQLSEKRMHAIEKYVTQRTETSVIGSMTHKNDIIDLSLLGSVIESSDIPHRRQALEILNDTADNRPPSERIKRLRQFNRGLLWKEIKPLLNDFRYASVTFIYIKKSPVVKPFNEVADTTPDMAGKHTGENVDTQQDIVPATDTVQTTGTKKQTARRPLYVSLKSNMLYDALLIPSIGAEVYLGKMVSLNANWSYAWWKSDRHHNYWRYYGGDIALRRWFGQRAAEKPLTGHHIGLYAQILTYDFELGGKGQMGNKYNYGGGIEYGFSLPIRQRINIDLTIGAGYLGGEYYEYKPIDGHYVWQATKQRHWFGPAKAEVSLVWLIGYGNRNKQKGDSE
ncbi:DUF3575 domain-containing protein [Xylanibacter muris]|uniref:DUF3575 domain-containing protein n=3 Tax=Xylanibacter muris TaxID=2736290 RepID=A0ABX2AK24_9BACT|nr:DUF3575 domain-containing protein [Xylanibacter muris]NPD91080.1 DUF3575 domain-containing protein [Xylanibacter muris]